MEPDDTLVSMNALLALPDSPAADVFSEVLFRNQDPLAIPVAAQIAIADLLADGPGGATKYLGGFFDSKIFKVSYLFAGRLLRSERFHAFPPGKPGISLSCRHGGFAACR
jgi:hypothetical protein